MLLAEDTGPEGRVHVHIEFFFWGHVHVLEIARQCCVQLCMVCRPRVSQFLPSVQN
jgi:hypothetical protein